MTTLQMERGELCSKQPSMSEFPKKVWTTIIISLELGRSMILILMPIFNKKLEF